MITIWLCEIARKILAMNRKHICPNIQFDIQDLSTVHLWFTCTGIHHVVLSRAIGIIRKLKNLLDLKTKLQLYFSLFQSHLLYCTSIYGLRFKKYYEELNRLQLKILSDIFGLSFSKTKTKMKDFKILTAYNLIKFQIGLIMYKAYQGLLPVHVQARFLRNKDVLVRSSISSFNFKVQYCNSSIKSNCLSITGVSFWNSLPFQLKTITSFQVFKCKLRDYLLTDF